MAEKKKKLPKYGRVLNPPAMRLTERDTRILEAIHAYDGVLSFSQIQRLFFTGKSQTELRLKLLYQNGYLARPGEDQRRRISEMIYWLDKKGAELIASLNGTPLPEFYWRKEPRWFQLDHDLAVTDFRLDLLKACKRDKQIQLENWIPESEFWAYPDKVIYSFQDRKLTRNIRPDGFFMLNTGEHRIRYLLEIDRSTEDNPRFFREKILPGMAYLKSQAYEKRFGHRSGRWLVVTTGERRLANMLSQANHAKVNGLFYFTTFDKITPDSLLHSPIWRRVDRAEPVPLVFLDT
ncbi:MAG: replication-relaxation family protein [Anaerolineales bacterium]|nr:replication-relaxation family protein [Anaerolineales bacterium]